MKMKPDSEVPYTKLDITIDAKDHQTSALILIAEIRPEWKSSEIKFKVFTEGITNTLFMCYTDARGKADGIVVRIFGEKTELIIDRRKELENMAILSTLGSGAPLYAQFNNGIAYGFVDGDCLGVDSVRDPHIGSLVAKEMARMHSFSVEDIRKLGFEVDSSPMVFDKIRLWISMMPTQFEDSQKNHKLKTACRSQEELLEECNMLERELSNIGSPSVFCHNDLLLNNIVYNKHTDHVTFIDFEYGAFNYEAFDLGNHFGEWAGIDDIDYSRYPDKSMQLPWLRSYLEHKAELSGGHKSSVTDTDVERCYVITNKFTLVGHFFWGIWALIQAKYSAIDFDYLEYAVVRHGEYFARKDSFLALQLPN